MAERKPNHIFMLKMKSASIYRAWDVVSNPHIHKPEEYSQARRDLLDNFDRSRLYLDVAQSVDPDNYRAEKSLIDTVLLGSFHHNSSEVNYSESED